MGFVIVLLNPITNHSLLIHFLSINKPRAMILDVGSDAIHDPAWVLETYGHLSSLPSFSRFLARRYLA